MYTFLLNVNRVAYFILIQISIILKLIYIIYVLIKIHLEHLSSNPFELISNYKFPLVLADLY